MSRNTKEVALIQHRSGNLAEMPKALHQAEIGLAKDANRLFIGNAINTILANRTEFPYQNLEILTEYSDLKDYFRYSYENNIKKAGNETDRAKLKEFLPIVVTCENTISPGLSAGGKISINGVVVQLATNDTVYQIVDKINAVSDSTNTYATVLQTSPNVYLTFFCLNSELIVKDADSSGIVERLGFPTELPHDIAMPERMVTEKLDDNLNITDFGIKGDSTNYSQEIYNALVEVYKNYEDPQFYRNVLFPAGTYFYEPKALDTSDTISVFAPFPLISNLHIHGEGIDRTIFKTANNIDSNYILVNSVGNNLNPSTSEKYGTDGYPENILIEDVTFESGLNVLCSIDSVKNITFNRVKFKGSNNTILVDITGKNTASASNITFNECIFEGGSHGIYAETFVENLTITNCIFNNINNSAIKLGDDSYSVEAYVRAVNINGNIITGTPVVTGSNTYAMEICKNVTYTSIHQTQFEERLFTNWLNDSYPRPYYQSTQNLSAKNFIDTLDPNTDEQKVLRFKFSQPTWEYLDYLVNQQGKKVLVVDKTDADVTAPNGVHIKESSSELDIRAVGTSPGNVKLSVKNNKDLILGNGTSSGTVSGNIQIKKRIQLNNNDISNETGSDDIHLRTASNKVIEVVQKSGDTAYETLIDGKPNALVNVAYVKRQIIDSYEKIVDYRDIANLVNGELPLITFDPIIYGPDIHLKRITLNVRTPFYKTFEFINKAATYQTGYNYFAGDVVKGTSNGATTYAVVINTHIATSNSITGNTQLQVIPNQPTYKDVKYVNVIGKNKILTQTYSEDYFHYDDSILEYVDIQTNNKFGYDNCTEFTDGFTSDITDTILVSYCDRNYVLHNPKKHGAYSVDDLHSAINSGSTVIYRKYDEGYCYIYEMDRNFNNGSASGDNPATFNYSGETLKLAFYDKDRTQITTFNDAGQLNPGGKLEVRIEFLREEVEGDE